MRNRLGLGLGLEDRGLGLGLGFAGLVTSLQNSVIRFFSSNYIIIVWLDCFWTEDDAGDGRNFVSVELNDEEFAVEVIDADSFQACDIVINPLQCTGNYSSASNNVKLVL